MATDIPFLGPNLFIIYMNDKVFNISESQLDMYAVHCTVGATTKTLNIVEQKLNTNMENNKIENQGENWYKCFKMIKWQIFVKI